MNAKEKLIFICDLFATYIEWNSFGLMNVTQLYLIVILNGIPLNIIEFKYKPSSHRVILCMMKFNCIYYGIFVVIWFNCAEWIHLYEEEWNDAEWETFVGNGTQLYGMEYTCMYMQ
jgi:hypothetical protein